MKILIPYSTRELSANSSYSVARLLYFLTLALREKGYEVFAFCRSGQTKDDGVRQIKIPFWAKLINKYNKKYKRIYFNKTVYKIVASESIDFVICATIDSARYFSTQYKPEKIIYWVHNYPERKILSQFLEIITKKKLVVVSPSSQLYNRLWNEFNPETLPFCFKHIPNLALPASQSKDEELQLEDITTISTINFVHVSGSQPNKGLHLILRIFKNIELKIDVNFIYVGETKKTTRFGRVQIVELPRMSYSQLLKLYEIADFGIISSLWFETAPLALHEMLEHKVVPVISKSGGMEEIVAGCNYVSVAEPNNIDEWTLAIQKCCGVTKAEVANQALQNFEIYTSAKLNLEKWGEIWDSTIKQMN